MENHKKRVKKIQEEFKLSEEVIEEVIKSPFVFIKQNSKDFIGVRIPNFGLFVVKPNRLKYLNSENEKN